MITSLQPKFGTLTPKSAFQSQKQTQKLSVSQPDTVSIRFGSATQPENEPDVVTQFLVAARHGNLKAVEDMLASGQVDVNAQHPKYRSTALHWAADREQTEMVKRLLAQGADPNIVNVRGKSALHEAVFNADETLVNILLEAGARPNLLDDDRNTVLHVAALDGKTRMIEALLKAGANPNLQNINGGYTPLHCVSKWGSFDPDLRLTNSARVAQILLDNDADPYLKDKDGLIPLELAIKSERPDVAKVLYEIEPTPRRILIKLNQFAKLFGNFTPFKL